MLNRSIRLLALENRATRSRLLMRVCSETGASEFRNSGMGRPAVLNLLRDSSRSAMNGLTQINQHRVKYFDIIGGPARPCTARKALSKAHRRQTQRRLLCRAALKFNTKVFESEKVSFAGIDEYIYRGGRDKFQLLSKAWDDIRRITVVGWGSQVLLRCGYKSPANCHLEPLVNCSVAVKKWYTTTGFCNVGLQAVQCS